MHAGRTSQAAAMDSPLAEDSDAATTAEEASLFMDPMEHFSFLSS